MFDFELFRAHLLAEQKAAKIRAKLVKQTEKRYTMANKKFVQAVLREDPAALKFARKLGRVFPKQRFLAKLPLLLKTPDARTML